MTDSLTAADAIALLKGLSAAELAEIDKLLLAGDAPVWLPQQGPQEAAFYSEADILFYGGAAGGGKGLALDTPLPTPTGWTTMRDVAVGDTLFDQFGNPC